jgi:LEA14-like dessication related protein
MRLRLLPLVLIGLVIPFSRSPAGFDVGKLGTLTAKVPKPTAKLERFDIKQVSLRDVTFTFRVRIQNPYPVDLRLDGVDVVFTVESNRVANASAAEGLVVPAKGNQTNAFDLTLSYDAVIAMVKDYASREYLRCDADVTVRVPLPKMKGLPSSLDFPFRLTRNIPAIKPVVSVARFTVTPPTEQDVRLALQKSGDTAIRSLDAKKVQTMFGTILKGGTVAKPVLRPEDLDLRFKVGFDIVLKNEAKAPFDFTSLEYNFQVNSNEIIRGTSSQIQRNDGLTVLRVSGEFSSKSLNPAVLNAFKTGSGRFGLAGSTVLQFPPGVVDHPLRLEFREEGPFKLR